MDDKALTLKQAAERAGVSPSTLRRWASSGVIPQLKAAEGEDWTAAAASHARVVARLRDRGHKLREIREATRQGRLAHAFVEDMFPVRHGTRSLQDAAQATGLQPALIERFWTSFGLPGSSLENLTDDDIQALRYAASCSRRDSRWWPSCSSRACTDRHWRGSPTPRCACFTSTCTSP